MLTSLLRMSLMLAVISSFFGSGTAFAIQAPDFKLDGLQKQIKLSKYRGKILYVSFWASWYQPCRKSFTWMNKMQSLYGKEGFTVIAINLDESREKENKFLEQIPANFDVAFDPRGRAAEAYQVKAMPSSYLIDKMANLYMQTLDSVALTKIYLK